ncbi:uncharacterized protein [Lepeophtheirus salmonis]|uniref:uncharacterized protein n=1 Tax=Lepeophtheirus salmonis TaxID=72036 RepID=UPI001AE53D32|nr:uncharacterized protein LOC121126403 [Lepeophtheirus salmonis]
MDKFQFLREIYPDILLARTFDRLKTIDDLKEVFLESETLIFIDEESPRIASGEGFKQICEKIANTLTVLGGRDYIEFIKCLGFKYAAVPFTRKSSHIRKRVIKCLNQLSSTCSANLNYYLIFADIFCLRNKFNGLYYKRIERCLREESKKI